ncbi:ECF transporter S component [Anaerofustis stercorihominis]|uniref:ECF transporter S component n=1 Tax=Anaerofustis stercorihominis TaxID=214853 RepID=UPI00210BB371|nr:ECF transporter S component [Anaerofustis stercorihominis]MCQ4794470.1 ECF transporter S component [Anaerofustis stercorihominis]
MENITEKTTQKTRSNLNVRVMVVTAMLSAVSFLLAFLEIPMPLSPSFAMMDLSDLPALIGAFAFGPVTGVVIELIKNGLQLFSTNTGGIGELANFLMGASFVFTAGIIYKRRKIKKTALIACIAASVVMAVVAGLLNYFVLLPMYSVFMPIDQVIAAFGEIIPFIKTKLEVILFSAIPANIIKGLMISVFTMLIYKGVSPILKGEK